MRQTANKKSLRNMRDTQLSDNTFNEIHPVRCTKAAKHVLDGVDENSPGKARQSTYSKVPAVLASHIDVVT